MISKSTSTWGDVHIPQQEGSSYILTAPSTPTKKLVLSACLDSAHFTMSPISIAVLDESNDSFCDDFNTDCVFLPSFMDENPLNMALGMDIVEDIDDDFVDIVSRDETDMETWFDGKEEADQPIIQNSLLSDMPPAIDINANVDVSANGDVELTSKQDHFKLDCELTAGSGNWFDMVESLDMQGDMDVSPYLGNWFNTDGVTTSHGGIPVQGPINITFDIDVFISESENWFDVVERRYTEETGFRLQKLEVVA